MVRVAAERASSGGSVPSRGPSGGCCRSVPAAQNSVAGGRWVRRPVLTSRLTVVLAPPARSEGGRVPLPSPRAPPSARCSPVTRTARPRGCRPRRARRRGWFGPGSTIWAVHADAATLVGGVRALLVQAMHPTVLAGFDQHSDYREEPESRLQRTAAFVTVTTFGTTAQAEAACDRVRRAHAPVRGRTPDGDAVRRRRPRAARLGAPRAGRLAGRSGHPVRPHAASTSTTTSPTWPSWASGSGLLTCRTSAAGLRAAWDHYLPQLAVTEATAGGTRLPARPAVAEPDPAALPGDRRGGSRVTAAGAARAARRPAGAARVPARLVGRAATRLLAAVLGASPAARAAHERTRPVGTVRG